MEMTLLNLFLLASSEGSTIIVANPTSSLAAHVVCSYFLDTAPSLPHYLLTI